MYVLILATLVLIVNFVFEYVRHRRNVMMIPIRIHINGTRGKSSVTRLIAAGLRGGGISTIAKTTGTLPRVIMTDGQEAAIERLMGANIIEQKYIFRYAAKCKPQAIVIECMAVNPAYQWITERLFVKSTLSVITNSRPDHLDLMGSTVQSVTMCLSNTIPANGECFTAEEDQFHILKKVAEKRNTKIHKVRPYDVTDEELSNFQYIEHKENLQLALEVCKACGVSRADALKGMQTAHPDPGALKKYKVIEKSKSVFFYNVFAANDPASTELIWNNITGNLKDVTKIVILNSRADRYYRSQQLVDICHNITFDYLFLTGEIPEMVTSYAYSQKIPKEKIVSLGEIPPVQVYERILELTKRESHAVGIGNIAGKNQYGNQIVKFFRDKSKVLGGSK